MVQARSRQVGILRLTGAGFVAALLAASGACAQDLSRSAGWISNGEARPFPGLELDFGGKCDKACELSIWHFLLAEQHLPELTAPEGGRAYRWITMQAYEPATLAYVQLVVPAKGPAELRSSRQFFPPSPTARAVAAFEAAIAKSNFASLPPNIPTSCLDECSDGLLEIVVDGRYRYIERAGGISDPGIRAALQMLDKLVP